MSDISILDTKSANFHSVKKAVDKFNPNNEITFNEKIISESKGLIIPGVSTTDTVLNNIKELNSKEVAWSTESKENINNRNSYKVIFENKNLDPWKLVKKD